LVYSDGVMVDSTVQAWTNCSMMRETRASIFRAGSTSLRWMQARAANSSCSISFIQSSLVWCWMMNSISLWSGDSGCWAPSNWSRPR